VVAPEIDLSKLTMAEKDAMILSLLPLVGQLQAAVARIAELEARLALLEKPPKTPDNSSLPPSKGQKASRLTAASHRARAVPVLVVHWSPIPTELRIVCSTPARAAPLPGRPSRRRRNRSMTALSCRLSGRT
jgi:transposase